MADTTKDAWCWAREGEWEFHGTFSTREEALAEARSEHPHDSVHQVARIKPITVAEVCPDGESVLERMEEQLGEITNPEGAEGWFLPISVPDTELLGELIEIAVDEWLRRTGNTLPFGVCEAEEVAFPGHLTPHVPESALLERVSRAIEDAGRSLPDMAKAAIAAVREADRG